jgi:hypothetical protein
MRFFKTHGFVKPLLREMLFRVLVVSLSTHARAQAAIESDEPSRDREETSSHVVLDWKAPAAIPISPVL